VAAADYTGRPVAEVQARLTALGLQVRLDPVQADGVPAGRVVGVAPTGSLAPGSAVTVSYAAAPTPATPTAKGNDKHTPGNGGHGHRNG
jgi:serine/threonine-protein kinase